MSRHPRCIHCVCASLFCPWSDVPGGYSKHTSWARTKELPSATSTPSTHRRPSAMARKAALAGLADQAHNTQGKGFEASLRPVRFVRTLPRYAPLWHGLFEGRCCSWGTDRVADAQSVAPDRSRLRNSETASTRRRRSCIPRLSARGHVRPPARMAEC